MKDRGAAMNDWVVPRYAHERELGSGASGRVVAAAAVATGKQVAIKYLLARHFRDPVTLDSFRREAELLKSPDIPRLCGWLTSWSSRAGAWPS
jgi:serine/threonine-protein kinase